MPARSRPRMPAQVVSDQSVLGGTPVVRGTRVPAETILAYLRAGRSPQQIFEDYPSLPVDGIGAVIAWGELHRLREPEFQNPNPCLATAAASPTSKRRTSSAFGWTARASATPPPIPSACRSSRTESSTSSSAAPSPSSSARTAPANPRSLRASQLWPVTTRRAAARDICRSTIPARLRPWAARWRRRSRKLAAQGHLGMVLPGRKLLLRFALSRPCSA